jgi:hypothetical protein
MVTETFNVSADLSTLQNPTQEATTTTAERDADFFVNAAAIKGVKVIGGSGYHKAETPNAETPEVETPKTEAVVTNDFTNG